MGLRTGYQPLEQTSVSMRHRAFVQDCGQAVLRGKGDPCFPLLAGSESGETPRTGALALWDTHCLLSEN